MEEICVDCLTIYGKNFPEQPTCRECLTDSSCEMPLSVRW